MKIRNRQIEPMELLIGIACLVAGLVYLWVYFYFMVPEDYYINKGPVREARANPYYAAQKYLQKNGVESTILYSNTVLEKLQVDDQAIASDDAIVLIHGRGVIHQKRFDVLWPWIEQGGTLISSVVNPYFGEGHDEDALFKELGISGDHWSFRSYFDEDADEVYPFEENSTDNNKADKKIGDKADNEETPMPPSYLDFFSYNCFKANVYVERLGVENEELALKAAWGNRFELAGNYEATHAASTEEGYAFARFAVGEGSIVINGNNKIWNNRNIACLDHARFLKLLLGDAKHVWFVVNSESPSLFNLVWKGVPLAIVTFALALVFMLWRALVRFGPVYPDSRIERRHFSEHIRAAAGFLYRVGIHYELITNLRVQIARKMQRKNPHFDELSVQQQIQALENHCDLKTKEIEFAFAGPVDSVSRKEFVLMVKILKALKEQL